MGRGRPPIPIERRQDSARGDGMLPGGHRMSTAVVPTQRRGKIVPDPPEGLGERGEVEWYKIWDAGLAWMHPAEDYHWVEQIAHAYDDIAEFRAEVKKIGLVVKGYAGQQTANPLLREIDAQQATIRKCLSMLGFSPADRAKLGLAEIKRQSSLLDLQDKARGPRNDDASPKRRPA